jgi:hypothetical protein
LKLTTSWVWQEYEPFPTSLTFISLFLNAAIYRQLQEYEQKIFGPIAIGNPIPPVFVPAGVPSFSFGFPKINDPVSIPAFSNVGTTSIFARPPLDVPPHEFTFGASQIQIQRNNDNTLNPNGSDIPMDGSWFSFPFIFCEISPWSEVKWVLDLWVYFYHNLDVNWE